MFSIWGSAVRADLPVKYVSQVDSNEPSRYKSPNASSLLAGTGDGYAGGFSWPMIALGAGVGIIVAASMGFVVFRRRVKHLVRINEEKLKQAHELQTEHIAENVQDCSKQIQIEELLRHSENTERDFRERLTALHEVNVILASAETRDDLCRLAVLLGKEKLGFERMGIWFTGTEPTMLIGSFGIDEDGHIRDERRCKLDTSKHRQTMEALSADRPTMFHEDGAVRNHHGRVVGKAPRTVASLWDGQKTIGFVSADALFSGNGITETQQKILSLFASFLGHLCSRLTMEQERQRLAQAVEQAAEAFVITDADGRIEYVNHGLTKILGYTAEEVMGRPFDSLYADTNDPETMVAMSRAIAEGNFWAERIIVLKKNGRPLDAEITLSPLRDSAGVITNFAFILRDISLENQLEEQLRQAAKMQAVGRLAGGVAHDFNNQLTVVKGYCDLLLRDLHEENPIWECITQIDRATRQAIALTGELLSFSRKQILKPKVIDPSRTLREMEKSLAIIGEDVDLVIRTVPGIGVVRVDPNRLEQAIMNLAINARDAMPDGGQLLIETANTVVDSAQAGLLVDASPGPYVVISIHDTGVGMTRETVDQVFEPFFTTKEKGKGTGLGMAMVYGFVRQSGGHISIDSQVDCGTTVQICLPRIHADVPDEEPPIPAGMVKTGTEAILVVEDSAPVRQLIVRILRDRGYHVQASGDPAEAVNLLQETPRQFDMLITDVVMPGMKGPVLAKLLLEIQPELKVLFVSGYAEDEAFHNTMPEIELNFLHKPFTPEELCRTVTRVLATETKTLKTLFD
ncbi:MAG: PAS domain S-box protein [Phycisphaerae bacterium]|nr:PAS domain S-box protein [Phycisphaerae bacterium]